MVIDMLGGGGGVWVVVGGNERALACLIGQTPQTGGPMPGANTRNAAVAWKEQASARTDGDETAENVH